MRIKDALRDRLAEFDGRAMSLLGEAEAALGGEPGYIDALLALISDAPDPKGLVGSGPTWLLKSFLEKGGARSAEQTQKLIATLPQEADGAHWSTSLHLCQSIRYLDLSGAGSAALWVSTLWVWVKPLLAHKRPFVRAWSLDALGHLAKADEGYRENFEEALRRASEDPSASVRARARGLQSLD